MPTVTVTARYQPAIRTGANITASAVQTVFARDGLYRKIPGPLTENIRLRLSHTGTVVGSPVIFQRSDTSPFKVTIEDWGGAVLSVMPESQQWSVYVEKEAAAWEKKMEGQWT